MNFMNQRLTRVMTSCLVLLLLVAAGGCSHMRGGGGASDPVSGYYAGSWYGPNPDTPLGNLTCTITPKGSDTWDALFTATFGGVGEYELGLEGQEEEGKVVFSGSLDLGATAGGVFKWNGEIVEGKFIGSYTSEFVSGTFSMEKTEPPTGE